MPEFDVKTETLGEAGTRANGVADALAAVRAGEFLVNAASACTGSLTSAAADAVGVDMTKAIREGAAQVAAFSDSLTASATTYESAEDTNTQAVGS